MTRDELEKKMTVLLGGRASEHLVFGHLSTGAADDLAKVTDIARSMVMRYGMDERLGHVAYASESPRFLDVPETMPRGRQFSEDIDRAVKTIIDEAFGRARGVLSQKREILDRGAALLLQKETLNEDDLRRLVGENVPTPAEAERTEAPIQTQTA